MLIHRWLWTSRSVPSRLARLALLPAALAFRSVSAARAHAYGNGLLKSDVVSVPTIGIGNLSVGGSGKTPIAAWVAGYYSRAGIKPGIVLRGYGGDEAGVHRKLVRDAVVVEDPDRPRGAKRAVQGGAEVVVLDDAYQRFDIDRDLNIALVCAESSTFAPWTLPAGPWREGWRALRRADFVLVTRKCASAAAADLMMRRVERTATRCPTAIVRLRIARLRGLLSGRRIDISAMSGARIVVAAGIADPYSLAEQCRQMGAQVKLLAWNDHQRVSSRHVRELVSESREADLAVVTEKDADKLVEQWPPDAAEPAVVELEAVWERGEGALRVALEDVVAGMNVENGVRQK